ncbi:hypothetical protein EDD86DRAFT_9583 [Gorgonomyces haynaldii]|nr:hypothetical protein EDD86DRAFT_9583 [Gorgonomyces haynaldii]
MEWKTRDKNLMWASSISGSVVGSCVGLIWRGPLAIVPGALLYGLLGGFGQASANWLHYWRISNALVTTEDKMTMRELFRTPFTPEQREQPVYDPIGDAAKWIQTKLTKTIDTPVWASPLVHAVDMQHRKKINYQIILLQDQVRDLMEEIKQLEQS